MLRLSRCSDLIGKCPEMKSWDSSDAFCYLVRPMQRAAGVITGEMEKTWPAAAWRDSGWSGGRAENGQEG